MSFKLILRGAPTRAIAAEYECPGHGRFELDVDRDANGDAPDVIPCPIEDDCHGCGGQPSAPGAPTCEVCEGRAHPCGCPSEWRISSPMCRVRKLEAVKGKSQKPERPTWLDTRNLGEGQPLYEWRDDRAKIREEQRKVEAIKFARENHERVIGGD